MAITLVPHSPSPFAADKLHVWVGVTEVASPPALGWTLDRAAVTPTPLRPLTPVLTGPYAGAGHRPVFTGCYELAGLIPGSTVTIDVTAGTQHITRMVQTLPASIPFGPQDRFNVLLLSCFHQLEDKTGLAGQVLSQLHVKPHLTLFTGDQVYLDLPTLQNFPNDPAWLGEKFQTDYLTNWMGLPGGTGPAHAVAAGFPQLLALAPNAFLPDDHEYWNNYPYASLHLQNTWRPAGRKRWKEAAEQAYGGFQQTGALPLGEPRLITIDPLSILLLDTRSPRDLSSRAKPGDLLGLKGRTALRAWADGLIQSATTDRPHYGMLVTGQSLFRTAASAVTGWTEDYELPNYEDDYRVMVEELSRVTQAGLPVLCTTGDVHWGRIVRASAVAGQSASIFEVISSPTSLVSTVFADKPKELWGAIRGLFGARPAWPRHADPESPPPRFGNANEYATDVLTRSDRKPAGMRGNHAIMLRFVQAGSGLDVEATCYPLHRDAAVNAAEQWTASFGLRPVS